MYFFKKPNILDEKELAALENIFHDTVYYLIKSGNDENVSLAKAKVIIEEIYPIGDWIFSLGCMVNTTGEWK